MIKDIKTYGKKPTILSLIKRNSSDVKSDEVSTEAYKEIRESLPLGG